MSTTFAAGVERIRDLSEEGDLDLASVEAIRVLAGRGRELDERDGPRASEHASLFNDLGALRFVAGDPATAANCLRAALVLDSSYDVARDNLASVEDELRRARPPGPSSDDDLTALATSELRQREAGLRSWLENRHSLHGSESLLLTLDDRVTSDAVTPPSPAWTLGDWDEERGCLQDTNGVAVELGGLDLLLISRGLERPLPPGLLGAARESLRPGGRLVVHGGPTWGSSLGHAAWRCDDIGDHERSLVLLPAWSHLLLTPSELGSFLLIALGPDRGPRVASWLLEGPALSRRNEIELRRELATQGFTPETWESQGEREAPTPALAMELEAQQAEEIMETTHPGFRAVLRRE
ncbi:MAG: hypothetical protein AAF533_03000 [Acidobacteriota bacterium]